MKNFISIIFLASIISLMGCGGNNSKQESTKKSDVAENKTANLIVIQPQAEQDTLKGSLPAEATGKIGDTEINISYHSPAVRGRIIWGGLVPYDKVWVTGAHMATKIEFSKDVLVANKIIPSGSYALFTIPGKDEWVIIINKNWEQHLADNYDEKDDVVRVKIKPEIEGTNQERLRYAIEADGKTEGEIVVYWGKVEISLPVSTSHSEHL